MQETEEQARFVWMFKEKVKLLCTKLYVTNPDASLIFLRLSVPCAALTSIGVMRALSLFTSRWQEGELLEVELFRQS